MLKKRFGMKRVFDKETNILSYKAKWWLYYMPKFFIKFLMNKYKIK